jgi:hypothetical protein
MRDRLPEVDFGDSIDVTYSKNTRSRQSSSGSPRIGVRMRLLPIFDLDYGFRRSAKYAQVTRLPIGSGDRLCPKGVWS